MRWRSCRSRAAIGTRFCGARGSRWGSEATSGNTAAVRSARRITSAAGSCALASHRTIPDHAWPPWTFASRTYHEYRRYSEMVNNGVRCRGPSAATTALRSGGRYVTRWLLIDPTAGTGANSFSGPSAITKLFVATAVATWPSAVRILVCNVLIRPAGSVSGVVVVSYGGSSATTGKISERPPPSTAHRPIRSCAIHDRHASRSQTAAPTANGPPIPATGPDGSSSVSRASTRRTPSTKAIRGTPSSTPSRGFQSSVSIEVSTDPSAGASASSGSNGAPYSGDQPSTKIRAMRRILPTATDASAQAGVVVSDEVVHLPPPA